MQGQRGQSSTEYLGVLFVVGVIVAVLATAGLGTDVARAMEQLLCGVRGETCVVASEPGRGGQTAADLQERLDGLASFSGRGGQFAALAEQARQALARGDTAEAARLIERLELYRSLIDSGPRGALVGDLGGLTDEEFDTLVARGTLYRNGEELNLRYFRVEPGQPGDGILAMDLFIPGASAGPLAGDDRGFENPLRSELGLDRSRVMVVIDRETGRGVVVQAETCTRSVFGQSFCNEPRPISLNGGPWITNDSGHDQTGEGINLDLTNQFDMRGSDDDSVRISYDALNSVSPFPSIDGSVELTRGADGTYSFTVDDRDGFPAYSTYQYLPGRPDHRIEHRDAGSPTDLIPRPDLPNLPDLPDLPDLPGPLPDLPNLPNLPNLPGL